MRSRRRPDRLAEALRGVLGGRVARPLPASSDVSTRLAALEREVQEVRTRINALFFTVLTAVIGEIAGRVVLG